MKAETVSSIKACRGIYSVGDTARHFKVSKSTVHDIWTGKTHGYVPEEEPPYITTTRVPKAVILEDYPILKERGYSKEEIANHFGIARSTLYSVLKEVCA